MPAGRGFALQHPPAFVLVDRQRQSRHRAELAGGAFGIGAVRVGIHSAAFEQIARFDGDDHLAAGEQRPHFACIEGAFQTQQVFDIGRVHQHPRFDLIVGI